MTNAQAALAGALLAIAGLAALGTPAPRYIATHCQDWPSVKLAYEESDLPQCRHVYNLRIWSN